MKVAGSQPSGPPRNGNRRFRVGEWCVDPLANSLERGDKLLRVEPRVMQLLICLAERAAQSVTRDELMSRVWPDCVVGDDALNSSVSKLRKALSDGIDGQKYIETMPKVGYRLVAPVVFEEVPPALNASEPAQNQTGVQTTGDLRPRTSNRIRRGVLAAALVSLALTAGLGGWLLRRPTSNPEAIGRKVIPVTSFPGIEVAPAFSPVGGERIAFAWKGLEQDNWDIYVQVIGVGNPLRLTQHPGMDHAPAWSPDGRLIAFARQHQGRCEIWQAPALGGPETKLADCENSEIFNLSWSSDGRFLAFPDRSTPIEPFRIVLLSLDTLEKRAVTDPPAGSLGDLHAAFSPDAKSLVFLRSPILGVEDAWIVAVAGGEPRRVTSDNVKIHGAAWTPDGRDLIFSSNRGGLFSLYRISEAGGEPLLLGIAGGEADAPSVAPDGRSIAYVSWQDEANIHRLEITRKGSTPQPFVSSTRWDWHPTFSPDGARIAFVSDRSGSAEIWVAGLDGDSPVRRTSFGGPFVNAPRWSPAGSSIAFDARAGANADIYLLNSDDGIAQRLTTDSAEDVYPSWSSDGRSIYFGSNRGGSWQIWKIAVNTGEAIQVTRGGGYVARESVDGNRLYFTRRNEPGVWHVSASGGEETLVLNGLNPMDQNNWLVKADALYFVSRPSPEEPTLTRFDLATRRTQTLMPLKGLLRHSGLALSPDGRHVFYSRVDRLESDITLLENFLP